MQRPALARCARSGHAGALGPFPLPQWPNPTWAHSKVPLRPIRAWRRKGIAVRQPAAALPHLGICRARGNRGSAVHQSLIQQPLQRSIAASHAPTRRALSHAALVRRRASPIRARKSCHNNGRANRRQPAARAPSAQTQRSRCAPHAMAALLESKWLGAGACLHRVDHGEVRVRLREVRVDRERELVAPMGLRCDMPLHDARVCACTCVRACVRMLHSTRCSHPRRRSRTSSFPPQSTQIYTHTHTHTHTYARISLRPHWIAWWKLSRSL